MKVRGIVVVATLLLAVACSEQVETVGDDCFQQVGAVVDQEFLEERNSSLVELGAGRRDLVSAIAQACREATPDTPVMEVAERAVEILNPTPLEER